MIFEKGMFVENFRGDLLQITSIGIGGFMSLLFIKSEYENSLNAYLVDSVNGVFGIKENNTWDIKKIFDFENYPELYL